MRDAGGQRPACVQIRLHGLAYPIGLGVSIFGMRVVGPGASRKCAARLPDGGRKCWDGIEDADAPDV